MVKATAADGKTPLHSVIGEGIFVSAVEFNKLYGLVTDLEKQVAEKQDRLITWRNLALQYDRHRMQALWWLRSIKEGTATTEDIEKFLKSVPDSGETIVKQHLEEVAKQQGSTK
ncbi:MAG: hypothetical protein RR877_00465 [Aurantimicrobium sp.]|uniref:hypothetical protein n=1 Tax=Aurantimicrobium sp. TaxID=1930784 RepID=UPI002FC5D18B